MSTKFAQAVQAGLTYYGVPWRLLDAAVPTRGNGQTSNYQGLLVHHTATAAGPAPAVLWKGRPDLSPPLCNTAGEADGTICFVSYNPANHAGASGGKAMGPLPVTRTFNKFVWGHEIVYPGTAQMTRQQYYSATVLGAVISNILKRGSAEWCRAHAETSITGKWDPGYALNRTIDMQAFRADVTAIRKRGSTVVLEEEDLDAGDKAALEEMLRLTRTLHFQLFEGEGGPDKPGWKTFAGGTDETLTVVDYLRRTNTQLVALAAATNRAAVQQLPDDVLSQLASAVADEVDARTRKRLSEG